jgi:hypothetical protein
VKVPSDLSHSELVELVTQLQRALFCCETPAGDSFIEFYDLDKALHAATVNDLAIEFHNSGLAPTLGSGSVQSLDMTLYVCDACSIAWEPAALRTRAETAASKTAPGTSPGCCPSCARDCRPIPFGDLMRGVAGRRQGHA